MSDRSLIRARADGAVTGFQRSILLVTSDDIPGRQITGTVGLVRGNAVRARHIGRDVLAVFKNIVGGELGDYTKLLGESREQALDRLAEQAVGLGADAVVALRFQTSMVMNGASEMLAYGTAVTLAPLDG